MRVADGTHFTCFTGTKVQILTQKAPARVPHPHRHGAAAGRTCFTGTEVQILTQKAPARVPHPHRHGAAAGRLV
jgi:hypothetical protein